MNVDNGNCSNSLFPLHSEISALREKYDLSCDGQFPVYCSSTSLRLSDFSYAQACVGQLILEGKYNLESLIPEISAEILKMSGIDKYLSFNKICGERDIEFLRSAAIIKFLTH